MRIGQVIPALPDKYNVQIGAITAKWATLEYHVMFIIWRAIGIGNEEGRVLTVGMGTQGLCGILRNLPKKWITDEAIKKDVDRLVKYIGKHTDTRNYIVHGIWTKYKGDPLPYLNFMKQGHHRLLPIAQAVSPKQLKTFSQSIQAMIYLAAQISSRLEAGGVAAPLPDTHGEQNPAGLPSQTQIPR